MTFHIKLIYLPRVSRAETVYASLRQVNNEMVETGFVGSGWLVCDTCRKMLLAKVKSKEKKPIETVTQTAEEHSEDEWTDNSSNAESLVSDEVPVEVKREQIIPAINAVLSTMGGSPIKTGISYM